jgi:hypothetical protein
LAALEGREWPDIVDDIEHSQEDVMRIRTHPETPSGSAPLDEALAVMQAARDALEAAASTVGQPRSVLGTRKPQRASTFAGGTNLTTEPGSFVVALSTPIASIMRGPSAELAVSAYDGQLFNPEVPFARLANERAMQAIARAVQLGESFVNGESGTADFGTAVEDGVSANLLESLVRIGSSSTSGDILGARLRQYTVSMRWAFGRIPSVQAPREVTVSRDAIMAFSEMAKEFRRRDPQPDTEITGSLTGNIDADTAEGGVAVLRTFIAASEIDKPRWRKIRVSLPVHLYDVARRAHADRLNVRAIGSLQTGGRMQMTEVQTFEIVQETDDD